MNKPNEYDLITIGAGSGGIAASRRAASYGAKVLLIEGNRIGGTCVLRGCIPKKLLMYASEMRNSFEETKAFGWTEATSTFDVNRWTQLKDDELSRLENIYREMLEKSGVELISGQAKLVDENTVEVNGQKYHTQRILIATGGSPSTTAIPGLEQAWTSDNVLQLRELPSSLLILGAGYIAVEFASILAGLGVQVSMVYRGDLPLRGFDEDLRHNAVQNLEAHGVRLYPQSAMESLKRGENGFHLSLKNGTTLHAQNALNATGRSPNIWGLNLESIGLKTDQYGAIPVDTYSRTSIQSIWAIGDVTNRVNLTPVAIAEGRAFADTEFGNNPSQVNHTNVSSAVFCSPPLASIGLTESQAQKIGPTDIFISQFRPMKKAFIKSEERTYMKLVVDRKSNRVLGAHMSGADAPEIIQSLAIAISAGATKQDFDRTMALHPTSAEEFVLMREPTRTYG